MNKILIIFVAVMVMFIALSVLAEAHDLTDSGGGSAVMPDSVIDLAVSGGMGGLGTPQGAYSTIAAGAALKNHRYCKIDIACMSCFGSLMVDGKKPIIFGQSYTAIGSGSVIIPRARERPMFSGPDTRDIKGGRGSYST